MLHSMVMKVIINVTLESLLPLRHRRRGFSALDRSRSGRKPERRGWRKHATFLFVRVALVLLVAAPFPAVAQLQGNDTAPGSSCTGFSAGATRLTADADGNGADIVLVCDGTTWNAQGVKVHYDGSICTAAKDGTLRYISASNLWEYCNGSAWTDLAAGSGTGTPPGIDREIIFNSGGLFFASSGLTFSSVGGLQVDAPASVALLSQNVAAATSVLSGGSPYPSTDVHVIGTAANGDEIIGIYNRSSGYTSGIMNTSTYNHFIGHTYNIQDIFGDGAGDGMYVMDSETRLYVDGDKFLSLKCCDEIGFFLNEIQVMNIKDDWSGKGISLGFDADITGQYSMALGLGDAGGGSPARFGQQLLWNFYGGPKWRGCEHEQCHGRYGRERRHWHGKPQCCPRRNWGHQLHGRYCRCFGCPTKGKHSPAARRVKKTH